MSERVTVFASFVPGPGQEDAFRAVLAHMVERTRAEEGCERYDLYRSEGEDGQTRFHLLEQYRDAEALEAHRAADYYKDYRARAPELLAEPISVVVLDEEDVAGS